jgi:hypothetical protein
MKKSTQPMIPRPPEGANGLKSAPQTVTVNLDQIENQTLKAVSRAMETYRMVIDAQAKQIGDLQAEVAALKAGKKA